MLWGRQGFYKIFGFGADWPYGCSLKCLRKFVQIVLFMMSIADDYDPDGYS